MSRWFVTVVMVAGTVVASAQSLSPSLTAVVETERAFASASVEHGQREAFLTYLADDGITFSPAPGPGKSAIRKRPAPANPRAILLNWAPMTGGVSSSGDLGFTTGPYILEDRSGAAQPAQHGTSEKGYYARLWTRDPGGPWKVLLEVTSPVPAS
jgi:ketosteroid isomerase-like protein